MNLFLRAKMREGVVRQLDDAYDVGPFSFNTVPVDRARFLIAFGQPAYLVGVCTQKMMMTSHPKPTIICAGESIGVDLGRIMQSITVRYDDSSFLILLVDYILSKKSLTGDDKSVVDTLSVSSVKATSVKYSFKKIVPADGWLFVERAERDKMVMQAIQYLDEALGTTKLLPIKSSIVEKLKLLHGRANTLTTEINDALKELTDKYQ